MNDLLQQQQQQLTSTINDTNDTSPPPTKSVSTSSQSIVKPPSNHPKTWTTDQVKSWLNWCATEYSLPDIPYDKFIMNGKALCRFTEDMFKQRVPNSGDILYMQLQQDMLKNSVNQSKTFNGQNTSLNYQYNDIQQAQQLNRTHSTGFATLETLAQQIDSNHLKLQNFCTDQQQQQHQHKKMKKTSAATSTASSTASSVNNNYPDNNELADITNSDSEEVNNNEFNNKKTKRIRSNSYSSTTSNNSNCNEEQENLVIDENSINSDYNNNDTVYGKHKHRTTHNDSKNDKNALNSSNKTVVPSKPKRTANLENVIGHLKERKLATTSNSNGANGNEDANENYQFSNPLLSPSSSSSSSSTSHHQLSASNQITNGSSNGKKPGYAMMPTKKRWMMDNKQTNSYENGEAKTTVNGNGCDGSADSAHGTASSPSSIRCDQDSDTLKENSSTPLSSCVSESEQPQSPPANGFSNIYEAPAKPKHIVNSNKTGNNPARGAGAKETRANGDKANNAEDPTRQIKFYDDYIDFRGDILRRPPGAKNCRILWEYLYTLLQDQSYTAIIRWEDDAQMVFRIVQAEKLAALWGLQKNRLGMTYEKLSRGMRYYYPNNIIAREPGRRLLYRFMRHPNEIKKFVKKNGTYMLKKGKAETKAKAKNDSALGKLSNNSDDLDLDEVVDEEDSGLDDAPITDNNHKKQKQTNGTNGNAINGSSINKLQNNNDISNIHSEITAKSSKSEDKYKLNNNNSSSKNANNNNNNNVDTTIIQFPNLLNPNNHRSSPLALHLANNSNVQTSQSANTTNQLQHIYNNPINILAAIMQQQQQQQQLYPCVATATNDEIAAAILMQIKNNNPLSNLQLNPHYLQQMYSSQIMNVAAAQQQQQQQLRNSPPSTCNSNNTLPVNFNLKTSYSDRYSPKIEDNNDNENDTKINNSENVINENNKNDTDVNERIIKSENNTNNKNCVNRNLPQNSTELPLNLSTAGGSSKKRKVSKQNIKREKYSDYPDEINELAVNKTDNDICNQDNNNIKLEPIKPE